MTRPAVALLLLALPLLGAERHYVGLSKSGVRIEALVEPGVGPTVLLIGGLAGEDATTAAVMGAVTRYEADPYNLRVFKLIAIPVANPDRTELAFPPTVVAYRDNAESHALWRWIALQGPDIV